MQPFEQIAVDLAAARLRSTPDHLALGADDAAILVGRAEPLPAGHVRALLAQDRVGAAEHLVMSAARRTAAARLSALGAVAPVKPTTPVAKPVTKPTTSAGSTGPFYANGGGTARFE